MFSEWATKRICKFFLKRLLGKIIWGELDLDRLDVQLGTGTIQLNDLTLNSDYLNEQLGAIPVVVREGFISSISIKIPWKVLAIDKCEIELEELELVIVPRVEFNTARSNEECSTSEASFSQQNSMQAEGRGAHGSGGSTYLGVHDGVKMIAKMMERLLLGLHVKIKNLIIAFEQGTQTGERHMGFGSSCKSRSILALRVAQTEYGTDVSEDTDESPALHSDNSAELVMLTKIVRFQGAKVDLYDDTNKDSQSGVGRHIASILSGNILERHPNNSSILDRDDGGFAGSVQLSIPWKSGCMDIPKVDAEISIDPIKLKFEPCTIQRMIFLLHSIGEYVGGESSILSKDSQSLGENFRSDPGLYSSYHGSNASVADRALVSSCAETASITVLPLTTFISDWVHLHVTGDQKKRGAKEEADLGASIDEFFECFDGTRSSHSSLANSSLWNWTCSVFSAITAASSLASGSVLIPSGQQRVEYNLKARLSGVSLILAFEDQSHTSDLQSSCLRDHAHTGELDSLNVNPPAASHSNITCMLERSKVECLQQRNEGWDEDNSYIEADFQDVNFSVQVCSQQVKLKTMVKQFEICEHLDVRKKDTRFSSSKCEEHNSSNMFSIRCLQTAVQDALPPFPLSLHGPCVAARIIDTRIEDVALSQEAVASKNVSSTSEKFMRITLLTSETNSPHQFSLNISYSDSMTRCTKFDAHIQPFILWADFYMANKVWKLIQEIENPYKISKKLDTKFAGERVAASHNPPFQKVHDQTSECHAYQGGNDAQQGSIQGNVFISQGRVILCFPTETNSNLSPYMLRDNFICIDLSRSANLQNVQPERLLRHDRRSLKECHFPSSSFINLNMGESAIFLVSPQKENNAERISSKLHQPLLFARKVFSIMKEREWDQAIIAIQWQVAPGTGPCIAAKAWEGATACRARGNGSKRACGNDSEFAAATAAGALEDSDSHIREEMVLSSALFFHCSLPHARLDLYGSDHVLIVNLLTLLTESIFCEGSIRSCASAAGKCIREDLYCASKDSDLKVSQSSIFVDCNVVDIAIHMEELADVKACLEKELPGSWGSFRLTVQKFEVLSVSNLGGISGASYLWLTHDEGELWGSLHDTRKNSSGAISDLFLLCCKNNALGRGDGGGANALAIGNAGATIIYLDSPKQLHSLTTVIIRCGTVVAPGGRLDWLVSIVSFFNQSVKGEHQTAESLQEEISNGENFYCNSFLLELLDVALSYEPTGSSISRGVAPLPHGSGNLVEESCAPVACILAAAALKLSLDTVPNTVIKKYMVSLQDVGLLVLDLSIRRADNHAYGAESLRCNGYVKIAGEALMEAVVKTNCQDGPLWEVECAKNHISVDTCHDTTAALSRLGTQLQLLFAPDFEESLIYLQTRRGNGKEFKTSEVCSDDVDETFLIDRRGDVSAASKENSDSNHSSGSTPVGLMDGILENAFCLGRDSKERVEDDKASDSTCKGQTHILLSGLLLEEGYTLEGITSASVVDLRSMGKEISPFEDTSCLQLEDMHVPTGQKTCFPFIEDYYIPESFAGSHVSERNHSRDGEMVRPSKTSSATAEDLADGRAGWYKDSSLKVVENHISKVNCQFSNKSESKGDDTCSSSRTSILADKNSQSVGRVLLRNFNVRWRMYAGSDWPSLKEYGSLPVQGECTRNASSCLEVELRGVDFQYDTFPDGGLNASKLAVSIQDFLIVDNSRGAPWKMVLGHYASKLHPRESSAKALKLELEAVKPDPSTPLEEYRLSVKLLPLRLQLHQSQLEFFIKFFSPKTSSAALQRHPSGARACSNKVLSQATNSMGQSATEEGLLPFFQKCEIWPSIIQVDYVPRRVDLAALGGGNFSELLNLVSWRGIELHLKHVRTVGVYGWSSVSGVVIGEWLEDISRNQIHKLIRGPAPIRSLFAVVSGAAKLVALPAEHYRKDRRLLRGMRRGAVAFLRSISLEAVGLGVHLAAGAHGILIHTESALGGIPPSLSPASREMIETAGKTNQPGDARQGLRQACESLTHGLERTASSLISTPYKVYRHGAGAGPAVASAIRAAPAAAVAPASAAAGAVHCALLGVRNSLDPDRKKESEEKHCGPLPTLVLSD